MSLSRCPALALAAVVCLPAAAWAQSPPTPVNPGPGNDLEVPKRRDAQSVTEDGQVLPGTFAARIGDQRVIALGIGGYDSTESQGGTFAGIVEGAILNRVALRVGFDYLQGQGGGNVSAGLRFGILRQELNGFDLGVLVQYKQRGFSESNGEIEIALAGSRRWNRFGLYANLVYGQGFEQQERDGEVRLAGLYTLGQRFNVGMEARSHFDLAESGGKARVPGSPPEAAFDLVVGPMASVSLGPILLLAEAGFHTMVLDMNGAELTKVGAVALAGAGATF